MKVARALLLLLLAPVPSRAVFHAAHVAEVMVGAGGDPHVQFVEIRMDTGLQNAIVNTRLSAFGCDGGSVAVLLLVPGNVPNEGAGVRWIMASPNGAAFLAASGIDADFTWDDAVSGGLHATCGMVCWGAPGIVPPAPGSWSASDPNQYVDCVAYGPYAGPTKTSTHDGTPTSGTPNALTPGDGTFGLTRVAFGGNNATDFALACPTPTNNAGATGGFGACPPVGATTTSTIAAGPGTTTSTLAGPLRRSRCSARKLQAAGRKTAAKARCAAKAIARGAAPDAACLARAEAAFGRAWSKAEKRADCLAPSGDRDAIEARVDAFLADLVDRLDGGSSASKCMARKMKAAGAIAASGAACAAKGVAKSVGVDAACTARAERRFTAAWSKAERRGDCRAGSGDVDIVRATVDGFVGGLRKALGT